MEDFMSLMTLVGAILGSGAAIAILGRPAEHALRLLKSRRDRRD
jgi:hypothetical protein